MKWRTTSLETVADLCLGKMLDKHKNKGEYAPYLANVNVRWGEFDLDDLPKMRFERGEEVRYGLEYGDIVMCEGGEPGRCAIWKDELPNMKIQKALHRIRAKQGVDRFFLYYYLVHLGKRGEFERFITGATIKHLPNEKLRKVDVCLPTYEEQAGIASILRAYDALIENNRRQIKLLEEAAQRLYKEWFIDLRFPGYEQTPITNGVPQGWRMMQLDQIADIECGQSPKSEYYNTLGEGLPFHQGVGSYGTRFVKDDMYSSVYSKVAPAGSILFSVRAPVGRLNVTMNEVAIGRGLAAMNHVRNRQSFLFYMLKAHFFKEDLAGNGAIFASISKPELKKMKFRVPGEDLQGLFEAEASRLDAKLAVLVKQNDLLTEARDRLLPKLMSGEIEVQALS